LICLCDTIILCMQFFSRLSLSTFRSILATHRRFSSCSWWPRSKIARRCLFTSFWFIGSSHFIKSFDRLSCTNSNSWTKRSCSEVLRCSVLIRANTLWLPSRILSSLISFRRWRFSTLKLCIAFKTRLWNMTKTTSTSHNCSFKLNVLNWRRSIPLIGQLSNILICKHFFKYLTIDIFIIY